MQATALIKELKLPPKFALTSSVIGGLLVPQDSVKPFGQVKYVNLRNMHVHSIIKQNMYVLCMYKYYFLRNVICSLRECFIVEADFHEKVVKRLRTAYQEWINQRKTDYIVKLSAIGSRKEAIKEVCTSNFI